MVLIDVMSIWLCKKLKENNISYVNTDTEEHIYSFLKTDHTFKYINDPIRSKRRYPSLEVWSHRIVFSLKNRKSVF